MKSLGTFQFEEETWRQRDRVKEERGRGQGQDGGRDEETTRTKRS